MASLFAQLVLADESTPSNNLSRALIGENWDDVPNYLDEIEETNEHGTTLHPACFFNDAVVPYNILRMLIDAYPEAAKMRNGNGNTPLHYSRSRHSDECAILLLGVAPETVGIQNNNGCTPLHYAIEDCRSTKLVQMMLQACPSALNIANNIGQTPLDCFFLRWYEPVKRKLSFIDDGNFNPSREQLLSMKLVPNLKKENTIGYVYEIMNLLLHYKKILDEVEINP